MRVLGRSAPLFVLMGLVLTGCGQSPPSGNNGGPPGETSYQITGPNQVILHVAGIS